MRTPASIAGHPIHPMLITVPIGLWVFSFACDLIFAIGSATAVWKTVALYAMVGGLIGALAAAIPGLIDLLSLPAGPRRTAIVHMSINLTVVVLFAINIWMRVSAGDAGAASNASSGCPSSRLACCSSPGGSEESWSTKRAWRSIPKAWGRGGESSDAMCAARQT